VVGVEAPGCAAQRMVSGSLTSSPSTQAASNNA
jgi:hypothetical protein